MSTFLHSGRSVSSAQWRLPQSGITQVPSWQRLAARICVSVFLASVGAIGLSSIQAVVAPTPVSALCDGWPKDGSGVPPSGHAYSDVGTGSFTWSKGVVYVHMPSSYTCSAWIRAYTYNAISTNSGHPHRRSSCHAHGTTGRTAGIIEAARQRPRCRRTVIPAAAPVMPNRAAVTDGGRSVAGLRVGRGSQ